MQLNAQSSTTTTTTANDVSETFDLNLIDMDQTYPLLIADTPPSLAQLTEFDLMILGIVMVDCGCQ